MLEAVSWKEYLIVTGLGVGLYYSWWLVRYYPGLSKGRPGAAGFMGAGRRVPGKDGVQEEMAEGGGVGGRKDEGRRDEDGKKEAPEASIAAAGETAMEDNSKQLELPL